MADHSRVDVSAPLMQDRNAFLFHAESKAATGHTTTFCCTFQGKWQRSTVLVYQLISSHHQLHNSMINLQVRQPMLDTY